MILDGLMTALANGGISSASGQRGLASYGLLRLGLAVDRLRDGGALLTLYDATHDGGPDQDDYPTPTPDPLEVNVADLLNPFSDLPVPVSTPRPAGMPAPRVIFRIESPAVSDLLLGEARDGSARATDETKG